MKPTIRPFLLLALSACGGDQVGTSVGNPPRATLDIVAFDGGSAKRTRAAGIVYDKAFLVVDRVRLRSDCTTEEAVHLEGPLVADLLGGGVLPEPAPLDLKARRFCAYDMRWKQLTPADTLPAGADPALAGLSMLVEGRTPSGKRFIVRGEFLDIFRLAARGGTFELSGKTESLFVTFDHSMWLDAAALEAASGDPITISRNDHKDLYMAFRDNVARSARLHRDADGDGALSTGERGDAAALAAAN